MKEFEAEVTVRMKVVARSKSTAAKRALDIVVRQGFTPTIVEVEEDSKQPRLVINHDKVKDGTEGQSGGA